MRSKSLIHCFCPKIWGTTAVDVAWTAPLLLASNSMPDYVSQGNNVGRRMVPIMFEKVVESPCYNLLDRIVAMELPDILCRALVEYNRLRDRVAGSSSGFWGEVPNAVTEWKRRVAAAISPLFDFLTMEDSQRGCRIRRVLGHVTPMKDLRDAYSYAANYCNAFGLSPKPFKEDDMVLLELGYSKSADRVNVCKSCRQVAKNSVGVKCCDRYDHKNREKQVVVINMLLERMDQ